MRNARAAAILIVAPTIFLLLFQAWAADEDWLTRKTEHLDIRYKAGSYAEKNLDQACADYEEAWQEARSLLPPDTPLDERYTLYLHEELDSAGSADPETRSLHFRYSEKVRLSSFHPLMRLALLDRNPLSPARFNEGLCRLFGSRSATTKEGTQKVELYELARFARMEDLTVAAQFQAANPDDLAGSATAAFLKYVAGQAGIKAIWDLQRRLDGKNGPGLVEDLLGKPAAAIETDFQDTVWLSAGPAPLFWPAKAPEGALDPAKVPELAGVLGTGSGHKGPLRAKILFSVDGPAVVIATYLWDGKDRFAVRVDDLDGTPLLFVTPREALGYDAFAGRFVRCSYHVVRGDFGIRNGGLNLGFSSWIEGAENAGPAGWTLDWASVLRFASHSPWSRPIAPGRWAVFRRSARGNACVAIVDPEASIRVRSFLVYVGDAPVMNLEGIDTELPIRDEDFRIPAGFEDLPLDNSPPALANLTREVLRSSVLRLAIAAPRFRESFEDMTPEKWKAIEKRDAAMSAKLREAFGTR